MPPSATIRHPARPWSVALAGALLVGMGAYLLLGSGRSSAVHAVAVAGEPRQQTASAPRRAAAHLLVLMPPRAARGWAVAALVHGQPAAWVAHRGGISLMRFDQRLTHLTLHAGSLDGGLKGWRYGDRIRPSERHLLIAAFNGGFKLSYSNVGFLSAGHTAVALKQGLASIVTYTDGSSDIGAWDRGVPAPGRTVLSVLQNQRPLIDNGVVAPNVSHCIQRCWGGTIGLRPKIARSGLGITATGQLVWAAGEHLTPAMLAAALLAAHAQRAIELDINPWWVAGYLYPHRRKRTLAVPVVPGQHGIEGALLAPYSRDFLAVSAN
jgi:hypothetical protein